MAIYMFTFVVFLSAFMVGIKAGIIGALIGLAVGVGMGLVFYSSMPLLFVRLPRRLGLSETTTRPRLSILVGWVTVIVGFIWLILCSSFAFWLTKFFLTMIASPLRR